MTLCDLQVLDLIKKPNYAKVFGKKPHRVALLPDRRKQNILSMTSTVTILIT